MYDKPYLSFNDQLLRLHKKNIIVTKNPSFVLECLESISYYTLINGYKDLYGTYYDEEEGIEKFKEKVDFVNLYTLSNIDNSLNSVFFKYIIYVEKSLKTKLSHIVAREYGEEMNSYLFFKNYRRNGTLDRKYEIENIRAQIIRSKNASIEHYRENKNHIPPWIAINGIYFGSSINWYKILQESLKEEVANSFFKYSALVDIEQQKNLLISSLSLLQTYRNNIAHGNRTFQSKVTNELPKVELINAVPKGVLSEEEYQSGLGQKDLFAVMLSIAILLNDPYLLNNYIYDLKNVIDPYIDVELCNSDPVIKTLELPIDYSKRIDLINESKFK